MSWLPNWITGYDAANGQAAADADARLRAMNQADYAPAGRIYEQIASDQGDAAAVRAQYQVAADYAAQDASVGDFDVSGQEDQIDQAFQDSLDQSAKGLVGTPLGAIGAFLKAILKAIPLWLWLALAVAAFAYFGGFRWLKGKVKA